VALRRVGLDRGIGYLKGGMFAWARAGLSLGHVPQVSTEELHDMMTAGDEMVLVDVRAPREFEGLNIEGAINIPAPDLRTRYTELDPAKPTVVICNTGVRSSLGTSLLQQRGFERVLNAAGGMTAYSTIYLERECPVCVGPHGPRFMGRG